MLETLFNSEYWETFQGTYFEEHLQTVASENVYETEKSLKLLKNLNFLFISYLFLFCDWFPLEK